MADSNDDGLFVLVVDDSPDARDLSVAVLEEAGYSATTAKNGKEALEFLAGNPHLPRLVVLDLAMPVMNGWELLAILRSYQRLAAIPIIVVSAHEANDVSEYAQTEFVKKPFEDAALLEAVRRHYPPRRRRHTSDPSLRDTRSDAD
jgi:CheY-like chemotaxis protein